MERESKENFFLKMLPKAEVIVILAKLNPVEMFSIVSQSKADRKYVDENDIWIEVARIRYVRNFDSHINSLQEKQPWELAPAVSRTQSLDYFRAMLADYLLEEHSFGSYERFQKIWMQMLQTLKFNYNSIPVVFAYAKERPVEIFSVRFKVVCLDNGNFSTTLRIEMLQTKDTGVYKEAYAALMKILRSQVQYKTPKTSEIPDYVQILLGDNLFSMLGQIRHLFYRMLNIEHVHVLMKLDEEKTLFLKNKV